MNYYNFCNKNTKKRINVNKVMDRSTYQLDHFWKIAIPFGGQ